MPIPPAARSTSKRASAARAKAAPKPAPKKRSALAPSTFHARGGKPAVALTSLEGAHVATRASVHAAPPPAPSNEFRMTVGGKNPPGAAGSFLTQLRQGVATASLTASALDSVLTRGLLPPNFVVSAKLRSLSPTPVTGSAGSVSTADYQSRLPGVSPDAAYQRFVQHPAEVFGAAGISIRPRTAELRDGARVMLQDGGPPPLWMPVQVHLDPTRKQITFATLDGHPLRGTNSFAFRDDGQGGTLIDQRSRFQGSSKLTSLGISLLGALDRQHDTWRAVHADFFAKLA